MQKQYTLDDYIEMEIKAQLNGSLPDGFLKFLVQAARKCN